MYTLNLTPAEVKALLEILEVARLSLSDPAAFAKVATAQTPAERALMLTEIARMAFTLAPQLESSTKVARD